MNKYYEETKQKIKELVESKDFELALSMIDDELTMPYIPMDFEEFLLDQLKIIPSDKKENYEMPLDKVLTLLEKISEQDSLMIDVVGLLNKYNLNNIKEEIIEFMKNVNSNRVKALVFEELIKQNFNHDFEFGNPTKTKLIEKNEQYLNDVKILEEKLVKYESLLPQAYLLIKDIYLIEYFGNKVENEQWDVVLFALSRIFEQKELLNEIGDLEKMKIKLETFNPINNI